MSSALPVIIGYGGINAAGRSSFDQGFLRMVIDSLSQEQRLQTLGNLAVMMGLAENADDRAQLEQTSAQILGRTLLRKIEPSLFDSGACLMNKRLKVGGAPFEFTIRQRDLPTQMPQGWKLAGEADAKGQVLIQALEPFEMLVPDVKKLAVQTGGQLPGGFDPGAYYSSMHHPRGLKMTVFGVSDAIESSGLDIQQLMGSIEPDKVAVYASSAMGQLDDTGAGGYLKAAAMGKRTSSKQMPLSLAEMPADFINAYVLGSVGRTGGLIGACASFLYNLSAAVDDIQSGRCHLAIVGNAEAPILPEVIEGYRAMSALAEDDQLLALDSGKGLTEADHSRACRPFAENCGFSLGESAQFFILASDELALQSGAQIFGSIGGIFVHADGIKKSISSPGAGNYLTLAKAAATVRAILGEQALRQGSFVQAHGTGTPQNRVTESHALNQVAKAFGITSWPVAAIKCFVGHSVGTAAGDQLAATMGTWQQGILPGIVTMDQVAKDVHSSNLDFSNQHRTIDPKSFDAAIINAKGFGGNNASATILSPTATLKMLKAKHGTKAMSQHEQTRQFTLKKAAEYGKRAGQGDFKPLYRFGEEVVDGERIQINEQSLNLPGFDKAVNLNLKNPYPDMSSDQD